MSKRPPEEPASRKVGYSIGVVGHLSACLLSLGLLFRSLGSPLVIQVPLLRSLGSRLVASAPRRCELAPPQGPPTTRPRAKMYHLCCKTNDFAMGCTPWGPSGEPPGDRLFIVEPEMAQVGGWGWGGGGPELSPGSGALLGVPHPTTKCS
jgi:hypothetical protein